MSDSEACCAPAPRERELGSRPPDLSSGGQVPSPLLGAPISVVHDALSFADVPGGTFAMGTDDPNGYVSDGEGPVHRVSIGPFRMSRHAVSNDVFSAFVAATSYVTDAERYGASFVFGGLLPDDFPATRGVVGAEWWREVEGAAWRHPEGPQSSLDDRGAHPVVHVSWNDAAAFCAWSNTRLPTEAEWERAARGGREGQHFPWGDELEPGGVHRMNVFQGVFPGGDSGADGWRGTCPVASFPPNDYGLHEMTGNVWEWCHDWFHPGWYAVSPADNPLGPAAGETKVMRGGSYLCHESYCWRYRVDARSSNTPDASTGNLGFRVVALSS